ncbi:MAG TPA: alpha/beta fold hydrolase [Casimicrobiaceae bacterium]|nr:alpha/beta fold hydrolase [Casimicrobiaceae bacterium]
MQREFYAMSVEPRLEVRRRLPEKPAGRPPLLFVHGGYCDAWCWEPLFLPWFAARGYAAHALSLRGHGRSAGGDALFMTSLADYESDVETVAAQLDEPPILIGHSMGAAIVELIMAKRPVRGAALLAPIPPAGLLPVATRLATQHPDYLAQMSGLDPSRLSIAVLETLRPFYFGPDVDPKLLAQAARHTSAESPRALFDLSLRLHWALPREAPPPVFVLGAEGDRICLPDDVRATARHHDVEAIVVPGLAHMLMLEPRFEAAAQPLLRWLRTLH